MKKISVFLTIFCMMAAIASALTQYTGPPQSPYLIFGQVNWNSQNLGGATIEITNLGTGYSFQISTNDEGYWQEDTGNWLTNFGARAPVQFGDSIKIKTLDGCGTADTCERTFTAFSTGNENFIRGDLSVTGALAPVDSGSSSSSSSSGGGGSVPAWKCGDWSECSSGSQSRVCVQGYKCTISTCTVKKTETQSCSVPVTPQPEPTPVLEEEPIVPVEPSLVTCEDGTQVADSSECLETKAQVEEYVNNNLGYKIGGSVIGLGFIALVIYWVRRNRTRAKKMVDTRIANLKKK